jgi:hypothetical protein
LCFFWGMTKNYCVFCFTLKNFCFFKENFSIFCSGKNFIFFLSSKFFQGKNCESLLDQVNFSITPRNESKNFRPRCFLDSRTYISRFRPHFLIRKKYSINTGSKNMMSRIIYNNKRTYLSIQAYWILWLTIFICCHHRFRPAFSKIKCCAIFYAFFPVPDKWLGLLEYPEFKDYSHAKKIFTKKSQKTKKI